MKFVHDSGQVDIFVRTKTAQGFISLLDESALHDLRSVPNIQCRCLGSGSDRTLELVNLL